MAENKGEGVKCDWCESEGDHLACGDYDGKSICMNCYFGPNAPPPPPGDMTPCFFSDASVRAFGKMVNDAKGAKVSELKVLGIKDLIEEEGNGPSEL